MLNIFKREGTLAKYIVLFLIVSFSFSCGSKTTQVPPANTSTSNLQPATAIAETPAPGGWEADWAKALQASKKEGSLVIYSTGGTEGPAIAKAFGEKFGLRVETLVGRGPELTPKIQAERRAGIYRADLYRGGVGTALSDWKPAGYFSTLEPFLILPEVIDSSSWRGGKLPWGERDHMIFKFTYDTTTPIVVNTNLIKPGEIKSFADLLNPRWKGKILLNDPTVRGTGASTMVAVGLEIMGWDFVEALARHEPVIIRDQRLLVEWVALGKYPIAFAPQTASLSDFMKAEAPIKGIVPTEGTLSAAGVGTIALINKAPNVNAAKVFVNWLLTREGQTLFSQLTLTPSARVDVSVQGIDPVKIPKQGIKYVASDDEEFLEKYAVLLPGKLKEIFGPLIK